MVSNAVSFTLNCHLIEPHHWQSDAGRRNHLLLIYNLEISTSRHNEPGGSLSKPLKNSNTLYFAFVG